MSDPGELGPAITPATTAPAATPLHPPPVSQHERDLSGQKRWNAPADGDGAIQRWRDREAARLGRPAAEPAAPGKPDPAAAAKPADGGADAIKVGDVTVSSQEMKDFLADRAAKLSGTLQAPASADEYLLELPKDLTFPPGIEVALDKNDPVLGKLRGWAHKYQLPQEAVSEVLGLYAGKIAGERAIGQAAHLAEVEKLGPSGPGRVDAIALWLKSQLGDSGKVLSGVRGPDGFVQNGVLWTADICKAFEALMNKQRSQGAAGYTGNGRDNSNPNDGKIPGFENMSFAQRRHAQEQIRLNKR